MTGERGFALAWISPARRNRGHARRRGPATRAHRGVPGKGGRASPRALRRFHCVGRANPTSLRQSHRVVRRNSASLRRSHREIRFHPVSLRRCHREIRLHPVSLRRSRCVVRLHPASLRRAHRLVRCSPASLPASRRVEARNEAGVGRSAVRIGRSRGWMVGRGSCPGAWKDRCRTAGPGRRKQRKSSAYCWACSYRIRPSA